MGTKQQPAPPGAPGSPAAAAAAAAAARRRFQAAGRAVIAGLKMGAEAARRRKADAELPPDPELQELLVGVDGQLHEVASMRASASGQARAKHLLHKCSGCDGDVASCVALLQSRTMEAGSAAHRHEMLRMVRLFSSEHAGSEPGRPPPLGRLYEDPVSEYWDMVCLRGLRALLRECLCTQSSRLARERRMTRIQVPSTYERPSCLAHKRLTRFCAGRAGSARGRGRGGWRAISSPRRLRGPRRCRSLRRRRPSWSSRLAWAANPV